MTWRIQSLFSHRCRFARLLVLALCLCTGMAVSGVTMAEEFAYSVRFGIADQYQPLLRNHLDIVKWQTNSDMNADQLQRLYRAAPDQIRSLLATEGYLDPQIHSSISEKEGEWEVVYDVDPGVPVEIDSVRLEIRGELAAYSTRDAWQQKLDAHFVLKPGSRFRQDDWDSAKKQALTQLLVDSYPLARIADSEARLDPATHKATLFLAIDSGPLVTLGEIEIEGLQRVPPRVVKRLTRIEPGANYRQSALLDFQSALQATPYFSSVLVDVSPSADKPEMTPIRVKVKEAQMQRLSFGVGYNSNTGARFEVNYQHSNVADRGWILAANTSIETRRQFAEAKLSAPLTNKGYYDSVFANSERSHIQGVDSQLYKTGVSRERDTGAIKTVLGLSYEREWSQVGDTEGSSRKQALVASYGWTRRDLDHPVLPTSGNVISLRVAGAGRNISSDTSFVHSVGRLGLYGRLPNGWGYLLLRGDVGQVWAERVGGVPSAWLFRVGGANSVRGYEYQSIGIEQNGAVTGGEVEATGSLEYQHALAPNWRWAVFADAGDAAHSWQDFAVKRGYGVGVRWLSPVGSIAADVAFGEPVQQWRMHIAIGLAF